MRAGGVRKENESTMTVEKFYKIMEEKHENVKIASLGNHDWLNNLNTLKNTTEEIKKVCWFGVVIVN